MPTYAGPNVASRPADIGAIVRLLVLVGLALVLVVLDSRGGWLSQWRTQANAVVQPVWALLGLPTHVAGAVGERALELTRARATAGARLAGRVQDELRRLGMPEALVEVRVTPTAGEGPDAVGTPDGPRVIGPHGADIVEILLAANPGTPPRPVTQAASGGELSRIMLALEVAVAEAGASVPTFVFDEVDAGVGGKAGLDVGARLAALAQTSQVLVVTHLAQVAAYADRHLVVRKSTDGEITSSDVATVEGRDRLVELARMMGGAGTEAGLQHAEELLRSCRPG